MKEKYALSPWNFLPDYDNLANVNCKDEYIAGTIRSSDGWNVARIWQLKSAQANAQLISAAPELLAACKDTLDIILAYQHISAQKKACMILQDVIEKAEGK